MPGWPNKISRASLGPTYQNAAKVGKPSEEADAAVFNLMCWQMAGMNLVSARAVIIGQSDGTTVSLVRQYFAWDPDSALSPCSLTRTGTGAYTWALPNSGVYTDMNGNSVTFSGEFVWAATLSSGTGRNCTADFNSDNHSGTMNCWLAGAAADIGSPGLFKKFMIAIL